METSEYDGEIVAIPYTKNPADGYFIGIIEGKSSSRLGTPIIYIRLSADGEHCTIPYPRDFVIKFIVGR